MKSFYTSGLPAVVDELPAGFLPTGVRGVGEGCTMYFLHTVRPDQMEKSILEVNNLGIGEGGGGSSCYLCISIVPTLPAKKKYC